MCGKLSKIVKQYVQLADLDWQNCQNIVKYCQILSKLILSNFGMEIIRFHIENLQKMQVFGIVKYCQILSNIVKIDFDNFWQILMCGQLSKIDKIVNQSSKYTRLFKKV